jgi:hypothetical protein
MDEVVLTNEGGLAFNSGEVNAYLCGCYDIVFPLSTKNAMKLSLMVKSLHLQGFSAQSWIHTLSEQNANK